MDNDEVLQLLVRIGREDQAAFRQLYKAFSRRVYAYAANMLNDHARCEEVVADIQGCPEGTVKTRLFHARQKIKNCLQALLRREGGAPDARGALAS